MSKDATTRKNKMRRLYRQENCELWLRSKKLKREKKCKGFSLIEVLIACFILSLSLLAAISAENFGLRFTHDAYLKSVALNRLINISERFLSGNGENEFKKWNDENAMLLPHGIGNYAVQSSAYKISLCWQAQKKEKYCENVIINKVI